METGLLRHYQDTDIALWGSEVCRTYFATNKLTFGMSELPPYQNGTVDPGHKDAHEVFICARGHVLCLLVEEQKYYELKENDALLIPPAVGHQVFNIGSEPAVIYYACAPRP